MQVKVLPCLFALIALCFAQESADLACGSIIFCNNDVLAAFQLSGIFNDSKSFVDMPLTADASTVLQAFNQLPTNANQTVLTAFLNEYFDAPGSDLDVWTPTDYVPQPPVLGKIIDESLRDWAYQLNAIWPTLGREASPSVASNPDRHTLLPVPYPFIIAGGRFREFYYWDSYWILNGLLSSQMFTTALNTLKNFFYIVDTFGFMPNGARQYYLERSQPPMLTQMVHSYYFALYKLGNVSQALTLLEEALPRLVKEHEFFMSNRSVNIQIGSTTYTLNQYKAHSNVPRPEGFANDILTAQEAGLNPAQPCKLYRDLASGAESGWDFSSRWFSDHENITTLITSDLVPVDLNAILYRNEITIYEFFTVLASNTNNVTLQGEYNANAQTYLQYAQSRKTAIENVLWNNDAGLWFDYNLNTNAQQSSDFVYASSFVPMWAKLYWDGYTKGSYTANEIEQKLLYAISNTDLFSLPGGMPTSMVPSGQQWDFPNGWAPLQAFAIFGLPVLGQVGVDLANNLASGWLQSNLNGWKASQLMYEKYNVTSTSGIPGEGGEYTVQTGFGWTNGVVFELLLRFCTSVSCVNSDGSISVSSNETSSPISQQSDSGNAIHSHNTMKTSSN